LKKFRARKTVSTLIIGQDFRPDFKTLELGSHIARIEVAVAQYLKPSI